MIVALSVLVPEERVAEFYSLVGAWYSSGAPLAEPHRKERRGRAAGTGARYLPLTEHLAKAKGKRVELAFDEVDELLGAPLPGSARKYRTFWANSATPQGRAWEAAGWRVAEADLEAGKVVFVRG